MAFKFYFDEEGKPKFNDKGIPCYIQNGASEPVPLDVNEMIDTNRAKHSAAESARKERDEIKSRLSLYEGIDPEAARSALEVAKRVEEGQLLDSGKVEELRARYASEAAHKVSSLENALEEAKAAHGQDLKEKDKVIYNLMVESRFSDSAYLREKTVLPPDFAYAAMGKQFNVEYQDGKPVVWAKDFQGNPIFSQTNPGTYANSEEAIEHLCKTHPHSESFHKNMNPDGGSGTTPGTFGKFSDKPRTWAECKSNEDKKEFIQSKIAQKAQ